MITTPLISVIIPLYNKETSIHKTIQSVLDQTFRNFELLVINDGSSDNSVDVVNSIVDNRIRVISKVNGGVSSARNFGVDNSKGEYIFFLDADDLISPNCLFEFNSLVEKYKSESVFVCNFKIVQPDKNDIIISKGKHEKVIKYPLKQQWYRKVYPRTGSMLIHKSCFDKIGLFQPQINIFEDLDFTIRLMKQYNVVYTPLILMSYEVEYIAQSKKIQALSNEFAYYIDLSTNDFYERLILSQNLYCAYMKRKRLGDIESTNYLFKKNKNHILFVLFTMVFKKIVDFITE